MPVASHSRRLFHFFAYHFYARPKISRTDRVRMEGFNLVVPPSVFHPKLYFSSAYLASYVRTMDLKGSTALDMGCGSGLLALAAAEAGARVTAIDINPASVIATIENSKANGLDFSISSFESDMFSGLARPRPLFDIVMLNPPYYEGEAKSVGEKAWKGGDNFLFLRAFISEVKDYLMPAGKILLVLSDSVDIGSILGLFVQSGFQLTILRSKKVLFERLFLVDCRFRPFS